MNTIIFEVEVQISDFLLLIVSVLYQEVSDMEIQRQCLLMLFCHSIIWWGPPPCPGWWCVCAAHCALWPSLHQDRVPLKAGSLLHSYKVVCQHYCNTSLVCSSFTLTNHCSDHVSHKVCCSLIPRLPCSGTRTLKLCRRGELGIFCHVKSAKGWESVERPQLCVGTQNMQEKEWR